MKKQLHSFHKHVICKVCALLAIIKNDIINYGPFLIHKWQLFLFLTDQNVQCIGTELTMNLPRIVLNNACTSCFHHTKMDNRSLFASK